VVVATAALLLAASGAAQAQQSAADFYKSKGLTIFVGSEPGGGYDTYGRLVQRHLAKHVPGHPTIVVKNMPGASGMRLANHLYARAEKDGSEIGIVQNTIVLESLMGNSAVHYQPTKFTWLGSVNSLTSTCVVSDQSPVQSMAEAQKKELLIGGQGSRSSTVLVPNSLNTLAGTKFKIVKGYPSTTSVFLAMERGEVFGLCGVGSDTILGAHAQALRDGKFKIIVQVNREPIDELKGVPWMMDYVKSEQNRETMEFIVGRQYFGRPFVAPPGTAPDKVTVLRKAFLDMMADKDYLADAAKQKIPVSPVSGEQVQAFIDKLFKMPKDVVERANRAADGDPALLAEAKLNWITAKGVTLAKAQGRTIGFTDNGKAVTARVGGAKVTIAGKKADRKQL
jgi:tripartite-type tricarboxylate transporter receptor subunit TctC